VLFQRDRHVGAHGMLSPRRLNPMLCLTAGAIQRVEEIMS
jgi:hypothetical protein